MGSWTVNTPDLVFTVYESRSHGTKEHSHTIFLMILSYAIFSLSDLSEAKSSFKRVDTASVEAAVDSDRYSAQLYVTNASKPETVTETIIAISMTLLAFTAGRNVSDYVMNFSIPTTRMMKTAVKKQVQENFSIPNIQVMKIPVRKQAQKDKKMLPYLLMVISIAIGFISMTIFSLLYFHYILSPTPEMP
ncbi:hypothetical protein X798_04401 [Onchocerca flexuosa]|uniref:Uncharacterized protein n=1 Tax=Onchocerca flexuosa TaxID=387005 RepID=A0A238BVL5_9BILA|nr:hypothetical protein X798_04401 [Onchocerca flexuosa]